MKCPFSLPCGWILRPVWQEFEVTLGKMIQSEPTEDAPIGYPYHKAASVQDGVLLDPFEKMFASEIGAAKLGVRKGDLLVCEGGDIGRSAIVSDEPDQLTIIQNSVHRVRSKGRYPVEYLKLVLDAYRHNGWLDVFIGKNTIAHFTAETFNNLLIPLPNPQYANKAVEIYQFEAKAIGDLLSYMESKLNKLSEYRQSLITQAVTKGLDPKAEMKDSEVPSFGLTPIHWKIGKFKNVAQLQRGYDLAATEMSGGTVPVIGSGGLVGYHNIKTTTAPSITIGRSGSVGKLRFIDEDFWAHNTNIFVTHFIDSDPKYVYYMLSHLSPARLANTTAVPTLDRKKILDEKIAIPSIKEQIAIREFLDEQCAIIQNLEKTIKTTINRLTEYRFAVISAAVTGLIAIGEN